MFLLICSCIELAFASIILRLAIITSFSVLESTPMQPGYFKSKGRARQVLRAKSTQQYHRTQSKHFSWTSIPILMLKRWLYFTENWRAQTQPNSRTSQLIHLNTMGCSGKQQGWFIQHLSTDWNPIPNIWLKYSIITSTGQMAFIKHCPPILRRLFEWLMLVILAILKELLI